MAVSLVSIAIAQGLLKDTQQLSHVACLLSVHKSSVEIRDATHLLPSRLSVDVSFLPAHRSAALGPVVERTAIY